MSTITRAILKKIDNGFIMEKDGREVYYADIEQFLNANVKNALIVALGKRKEISVSFEMDEVVRCVSRE